MSEAMAMGGMEFEGLLERVLRERRNEAEAPAGLVQRLKARLAQEPEAERPFAFAEQVKTRWSTAAVWAAVAAHVAAIAMLFVPVTQPRVETTHRQMAMVAVPARLPELRALPPAGGGGGTPDVAPVAKGRLPKVMQVQIVPLKAPPAIAPKLAVEPSVVVQPNVRMATNSMPNLGLPSAPAATVGGLGTGSGGGIGSGAGNGIGPGSGGNTGGGVYHLGGGVRAPVLVNSVEPEYSEEARKAKFTGNVVVELIVDERGLPTHVHVVRGAGLGLDEKAVEAVRQYRFRPATREGKPVKVELDVELDFQIF